MSTHREYLQQLQDWMELRNYSAATVSAYGSALRQFLEWREAEGFAGPFKQEEARRYLLSRYRSGKKWQTVNGDYSAMRKFYEHVLGGGWDVEHLPRPRKERALPAVLSVEEVGRLISHGRTLKHQAFMALLYGTGLRLGEALGLRIADVDGGRLQLRVVKGKGAKCRYVCMPPCLLGVLRDYYRASRPEVYLFNGKYRASRWAARSAQHALQQARESAGIAREVSPHVLRHCYATHHLENGTNLVYLKDQLGHKNLKTTARYIHLSQEYRKRVCHPLASMELVLKVQGQ